MTAAVAAPGSPFRALPRGLEAAAGDRLDEIFAEPYARLLRWRKDSAQASHAAVQQGMKELLHERSRLESLRDDQAAAEQERESVLRLRAEAEHLQDRLRQSSEAAARRADGVLRTKEGLLRAWEECRQRLAREEEALRARRRAAEARDAEVESLLGLYGERLGLCCRHEAPQTVRMVFTLIDPADPAREFSFLLGLGNPLEYQVFDCSHAVPDLDERIAHLNVNGHSKCALPAFLCGMRRAFQAVAATEDQ